MRSRTEWSLALVCLMTTLTPAQEETRNYLVDRDLTFLSPDRPEKLDLYLPPDPKPGTKRPAVIVIHGGGWKLGDKADDRETQIAGTLANAGFVVVSINYQLAMRDKPAWPTCLDDCRAAVRWLREHAEEYAIDPDRLGAIGGSAGGSMSLLIALDEAKANFKRVQAVVALYPPTDLVNRKAENQLMFGHSREARPDLYRDASILVRVEAGFPPTLLIHGTADTTVPHDHSERLAARLKELGVPHELILVPDAPHTFPIKSDRIDLRAKVVEFFVKNLSVTPNR